MTDEQREALCKQRAELCKKYAKQFWDEEHDGKFPNLALIINDAIGEGITQYVEAGKEVSK